MRMDDLPGWYRALPAGRQAVEEDRQQRTGAAEQLEAEISELETAAAARGAELDAAITKAAAKVTTTAAALSAARDELNPLVAERLQLQTSTEARTARLRRRIRDLADNGLIDSFQDEMYQARERTRRHDLVSYMDDVHRNMATLGVEGTPFSNAPGVRRRLDAILAAARAGEDLRSHAVADLPAELERLRDSIPEAGEPVKVRWDPRIDRVVEA